MGPQPMRQGRVQLNQLHFHAPDRLLDTEIPETQHTDWIEAGHVVGFENDPVRPRVKGCLSPHGGDCRAVKELGQVTGEDGSSVIHPAIFATRGHESVVVEYRFYLGVG